MALAARVLRRYPVFAATAIVAIALGIGAATAVFSVANAVLLRPLPYSNPDRLVIAYGDWRKRSVNDYPISSTDFLDLRAGAARTFEDMGVLTTGRGARQDGNGSMEQVRFASVTPNFFRLMGARMAFGRDFDETDVRVAPPANNAAGAPQPVPPLATILSYEYWRSHFGDDRSILGRNAPGTLPGSSVIVGVLAPRFELLFPPGDNLERAPDNWFAIRPVYDNVQRNVNSWRVIGRLRSGATLDQARSQSETTAAEIRRINAIHAGADFHFRLEPMNQHLVEGARPTIVALLGAAIFVLLIGCANVANLLLVRASLRERESAVRAALGGSRGRLICQTLAEALLLSGLGALLGTGLAWAGLHGLIALAPTSLPRRDSIAIDAPTLAFVALAAFAAAILFGFPLAWHTARPDLMRTLRAAGRTGALAGAPKLRNAAVIAEVALAFVLLIGSGLLLRGFRALQRVDPGYEPHGLLTFQLLGNRGGNQSQGRAAFMRDIQNRLRELPGVESVAAANPLPLAGGVYATRWGKEDALADPTKYQGADFIAVLPDYFETMRTRLIAGRTFTPDDNAPERKVVIVDRLLAAKAFPHESAVGKRILFLLSSVEPESLEIIGVVAHQHLTSLSDGGREQIYTTDAYRGYGVVDHWAIRTAGDPTKYAAVVRREIGKLDSRVFIAEMQPMDALVNRSTAAARFALLLLATFATVAALMAAVGLYGVLSTSVRQRTAEIGVRMALGATPARIFRMVARHALYLSAAGLLGGLAASFALTRWMGSLLFGVKPIDPFTFGMVTILFLAVVAAAAWTPARRAAALDFAAALREE
jgi:putative ABC transport system permease protein